MGKYRHLAYFCSETVMPSGLKGETILSIIEALTSYFEMADNVHIVIFKG